MDVSIPDKAYFRIGERDTQRDIREKVIGFTAHVTLLNSEIMSNPEELYPKIEALPGVQAVSAFVGGPVLGEFRQRIWTAFVRGVLCNWLVCLAVFMATAARDVTGKMLACYVPIMTFVASGFEHSVANMYFIPAGLFLNGDLHRPEPLLSWWNFGVSNLLPVTAGNVVGGVLFVASAYWYVHLNTRTAKVTP